jgi:hypothetical protein
MKSQTGNESHRREIGTAFGKNLRKGDNAGGDADSYKIPNYKV